MAPLRHMVSRCLFEVDHLYRRYHRLQPVGEVLSVGRRRYRGSTLAFDDGTRLVSGETIGTLHFNNARLRQLDGRTPAAAGTAFARLMRTSLAILAEKARHDPAFSGVAAYHGVTWLPPHGRAIGFTTRPLPDGTRTRLLARHFQLLIWAYAPGQRVRGRVRPVPIAYWITRRALLQHFPNRQETAARCSTP